MPRVVHFEIPPDHPERASRFYTETFGWTFRRWDGPQNYWMVSTGADDQPAIDGGLVRTSDGPSGNVNTIDVDSLETYIGRVEANGGSVVAPRMAVPGVGWFAYCRDPEGNVFGMMQFDETAA